MNINKLHLNSHLFNFFNLIYISMQVRQQHNHTLAESAHTELSWTNKKDVNNLTSVLPRKGLTLSFLTSVKKWNQESEGWREQSNKHDQLTSAEE